MSTALPPPRVSVLIPTRNRAPMLRRALDSVLAQTAGDLEVIVADDGSTHGTAQLVQEYQDCRVRYLRLEGVGAPQARNAAFAVSRGEFIAYLDDDDEWLPGKLAAQLRRFTGAPEQLALVYTGAELVSAVTGRVVHTFLPGDRHFSPADLLLEIPFTTPSVLIRREALGAVGGWDPVLAGAQDRDLWIRIARRFLVGGVSEVLVRYYIHGNQISSTLNLKIRAKEQLLDKYRDDLRHLPRARSYHLWRLGILRCVDGQVGEGRRALLAAIAAQPLAWHAWRDLLTAALARPDACADALMRRRVNRIDGIPNYY